MRPCAYHARYSSGPLLIRQPLKTSTEKRPQKKMSINGEKTSTVIMSSGKKNSRGKNLEEEKVQTKVVKWLRFKRSR